MLDTDARRPVGTTQLRLGPFGLGVAPLGNLYSEVSEADAQATLAEAQRRQISWFDVAPKYGFGLAEERLGRFLRETSQRPIISTKVGRLLEPADRPPVHAQFVRPLPYREVFDYSREGIERSYADSLRRLGRDRVDILLLHDVDRPNHPSGHRVLVRQLLDEALPALTKMKEERRVAAVGLGVCEWDIGFEILLSADIDCVLLAGRYTLLDASAFASGFLDACARRKVSVLAGGVFNAGFLAGGSRYDYHSAEPSLIERRNRLQAICGEHGVLLPAAALQFTAAHPAITSVAVGARSAQEVDDMLQLSRVPIPEALWVALRRAQFIPEDAPTPAASA
jgi:D-threo-aldose 1-dehydrogenase